MQALVGLGRSRARRKAFADEMKDMLKLLTDQENLLLNSPDAVLVLDLAGVVAFCSPSVAEILFRAHEEVENQHLAMIAAPSSRRVLGKALNAIKTLTGPRTLRLELLRSDGERVCLDGVLARAFAPARLSTAAQSPSVADAVRGHLASVDAPPDAQRARPAGEAGRELALALWPAADPPPATHAAAARELDAAKRELAAEDEAEAACVRSESAEPARARDEDPRFPAAVRAQVGATFRGVAPFLDPDAASTAYYGAPRPRGWDDEHLAADVPLARAAGNLEQLAACIGRLGRAVGEAPSVCFSEVDAGSLLVTRTWGSVDAVLGAADAGAAGRHFFGGVAEEEDVRSVIASVIDPARQGRAGKPVLMTRTRGDGQAVKVVVVSTSALGAAAPAPQASLEDDRVVLAERLATDADVAELAGDKGPPSPKKTNGMGASAPHGVARADREQQRLES